MFKEGITIALANKKYIIAFAVMSILVFIAYSMLLKSFSLNLSMEKIAFGLDIYVIIVSAALGICCLYQ
jgi:predicted tellurium resistance membrane protein TerC